MKKIFTSALIFVVGFLVVLVLWMNFTPGYFQSSSCCCRQGDEVRYLPIDYRLRHCGTVGCITGVCPTPAPSATVKLLLALLDFNK
jgi:hypothetical protein